MRSRSSGWTALLRSLVGLVWIPQCAAACSDDEARQAEVPADSPEGGVAGYFDAATIAELEGLGLREYEGRAVATGEQFDPVTGITRVEFDPASGPVCLFGPFAAFYADRQSDSLAILLDGGGACWSGTCSTTSAVQPSISDFARDLAAPEAATGTDFRAWNLVSVPYCDGSVFMGDNQVVADGRTRFHHGRQNLAAALDLAETHFPAPRQILLGGVSAGGYGTLTAMIAVRLRYPTAELFVFDDSGPGVFNLAATEDMQARLAEWNYAPYIPPSCTECDGGRGQLSPLFEWMLERDSGIRIGVTNFLRDETLGIFLRLTGEAMESLVRAELNEVAAVYPRTLQALLDLSAAAAVRRVYRDSRIMR